MGIFSKFRENAVEWSELKEQKREITHNEKEFSLARDAACSPIEKGLIESVGDMLQNSAHNVKEAVFGHVGSVSNDDIGSYPLALAMEEPFGQSDPVLTAVFEHDVRSMSMSAGQEQCSSRKTIVQTVSEKLAQSAHTVKDAVLSHRVDVTTNYDAQVATPVEHVDSYNNSTPGGTDDHRRTIMEAMGEIMSHSMQTVKDVIGNHNDVVEYSPDHSSWIGLDKEIISNVDVGDDRKKTVLESVSEMLTHSVETVKEAVLKHNTIEHGSMHDVHIDDHGKPKEHEEDEEVKNKGLIQSVKEAALEVKEEVMEAVQEVKDAVLSNTTLPSVPESITEDSGERPSMELVHAIVHD